MTFDQFLRLVDETYNEKSFEFRYGQTIMNVLSVTWPEKYRELTNSSMDCFYDDGLVSSVLDKLKSEW